MSGSSSSVVGGLLAAILVLVAGLIVAEPEEFQDESGMSASASPLFDRRLGEMEWRLGAKVHAAPHAPAMAPSQMVPTQAGPQRQQAFLLPSEAASTCVASGCFQSGCVGSGCFGSACVGSGCVGSGCSGSSCENCNQGAVPGPLAAGAYCPLDGETAIPEARIAGFEVAPHTDGTEIRFAVYGAEIESYRVYRQVPGQSRLLLALGHTAGDRLIRVVAAGAPEDAGHAVEVVDALGRVTRVQLSAASPQTAGITAQVAPGV